jgi:segregation and condensation protein B
MEIKSKIESLLFVSAKPVSVKMLSKLSGDKFKEVKNACEALMKEFKEKDGGLQIIKNGENYQMVSSSKNADLIQKFVKNETKGELSRPSLETLTIITYRSPVSKTDLDRIRGVNCSLILRNLLIRGLIEAKNDKVKNETYYSPSFDFIKYLGINDVKELPDYDKLSKHDDLERMLKDQAGGESNNEDKQ